MMKTNISGAVARCRSGFASGIRCKGVIALAVWVAAAWCQPVAAQSWQNLFKDLLQSLGGSSETTQQTATTPVPPSAKELRGTWTYQAPAILYTGSDMLATLAVATLEGQLPSYYQQAGLQTGNGTFTFERNGTFVAALGTNRLEGTYGYDAAAGALTLCISLEGKQASFNGKATYADGVLTLLFEASETLRTLRTASAKFAQNQRVQQISAILDAYPGIMLGAKLKR